METVKIIQTTATELRALINEAVEEKVKVLINKRKHRYSKREARAYFGCAYPTLDRWAKKGLLDRVEMGGRVYYTADSVERLGRTK